MQLTVQQVYDATLVIAKIIREGRPMPQKGKFQLARMHAKLLPEFNIANAQREDMIKAYDTRVKVLVATAEHPEGEETEGAEYMVPPDKMAEFNAAGRSSASR
jgi:hypothetical protein